MIILGDHDFLLRVSNFSDWTAFRATLAISSLRVRRNGIYEFPVKILTPEFDSLTIISL